MSIFTYEYPSLESYWRSIILFGQNNASHKFALGKALLECANTGQTFVPLEDLAIKFSKHVSSHLKDFDKQGTSPSSQFHDSCRSFNLGKCSQDDLVKITMSAAFPIVFQAFHVVNREDIPQKFFEDNSKQHSPGITVTDELFKLKESCQFVDLPIEIEARWRLVETAWELKVSQHSLEICYDPDTELLLSEKLRRKSITSCRDALNGYQKGKCFYCFSEISVSPFSQDLADVDHFFPHILKQVDSVTNFDGVWNLVLACKECNRGVNGKFARIPQLKYIERLHKRNSFFIDSHHPLHETLVLQTGKHEVLRREFLQKQFDQGVGALIHLWEPSFEHAPCF